MARNDKFRAGMKNTIAKAQATPAIFMKELLVELSNRVIMKSPVDTGRFRANWNVGNGSIDYATSESTDKQGNTALKNSLEINSIKINGQTIYITNSLPYAYRLEYEGWSKVKAPAGMVRVTLAELNSITNKVAFEVKGR